MKAIQMREPGGPEVLRLEEVETPAAGAGEVLVSEAASRQLDEQQVSLKRKRRFKAKGAPKDLDVFAAELA